METRAELSRRWVARLRREDAEIAAGLRLNAQVEAALDGEHLWLRGHGEGVLTDLVDQPVVAVFETEDDIRLHSPGARVPTDRLPAGLSWIALAEMSRPVAVSASRSGRVSARMPLQLVRSAKPRGVNLLRLKLSALLRWAETAPAHRLAGLQYACSEDGWVVVMGARLPSVSAERFVSQDGMAVPAGWQLDPPVSAATVRTVVGAPANSIVLINRAGDAETIEWNHFVPLSRASVRLTAQRREDG